VKALSFAAACVASALLAACGSSPRHQPATAQGAGTAYGAGRMGMGDMMGDRQAMCELNRRMRAARTPEERHAMVDKYMGAMSPEARHHLLTMMQEQCR
jgi:hypothetical protein